MNSFRGIFQGFYLDFKNAVWSPSSPPSSARSSQHILLSPLCSQQLCEALGSEFKCQCSFTSVHQQFVVVCCLFVVVCRWFVVVCWWFLVVCWWFWNFCDGLWSLLVLVITGYFCGFTNWQNLEVGVEYVMKTEKL